MPDGGTKGMATTAVVVSRSRVEREVVVRAFEADDRFRPVGCRTVREALTVVKARSADVVIAPLTDPDFFPSIERIAALPTRPVIVASAVEPDRESLVSCARVGVSGYIDDDATIDEWLDTVSAALRGELNNPKVAGLLLQQLSRIDAAPVQTSWRVRDDVAESANRVGLTPRERQIVGLIDQGMSNKAIANQLHLEISTVKNHVHAILKKYGVRHRGEAAARFRQSSG